MSSPIANTNKPWYQNYLPQTPAANAVGAAVSAVATIGVGVATNDMFQNTLYAIRECAQPNKTADIQLFCIATALTKVPVVAVAAASIASGVFLTYAFTKNYRSLPAKITTNGQTNGEDHSETNETKPIETQNDNHPRRSERLAEKAAKHQ